ncbi:cytolysin Src-1-like [Stegastes partitus]|uniref:Cytolysin Src-1-like n=1 Tax=Stegastes partitus TaxID=144197 RepID=A0A3B4ZVD5_9TELE|nr:PREDICTED: cytolysin Src-1-like [Stegastes partitus]
MSQMPNASTVLSVFNDAASAFHHIADLIPTHRECSIEITNDSSQYILSNPGVYLESGSCSEPLPPEIEPSSSGKALFTKTANTARGVVGVVTYDLVDESTQECAGKMAVMFSVPYDFNLYSNWYAVGVFEEGEECSFDLYDHMYNNTDSTFVRGRASESSLSHEGELVAILASMSDSYQPMIKVEVKDVCQEEDECL